ncbi:MAG: hypothetical protein KC964_14430, partial [Candidatus Omnitrophica bacterium]|nr:hypothetical protein [Candidatus Omnitrophota bacterium]
MSASFEKWCDFVMRLEERFPQIDDYIVMGEPTTVFQQVFGRGDNERYWISYWHVMKETKHVLEMYGPENKLHMDLNSAGNDDEDGFDDNPTNDFLAQIINEASKELEEPVSATDAIGIVRDVVDILNLHPHIYTDTGSGVQETPYVHARRSLNRAVDLMNREYDGIPIFEGKEVWVDEMGDRKTQFSQTAGNSTFRGLPSEQIEYGYDAIEHGEFAYELYKVLLSNNRIKRACWYTFKDISHTPPTDQMDWGHWAYHFSKTSKGDAIVSDATDSWRHPILGYTKGDANSSGSDFVDYYYGEEVLRHPSFEAIKSLNRGLPMAAIPIITSVTIDSATRPRLYNDGSCTATHTIEVTLDPAGIPAAGTVVLKIDGIAVAQKTGNATGDSEFTFVSVDICTDPSGSDILAGQKETLHTPSRFHRLTLEFDLNPAIYKDKDFDTAETPHKFIIIE